MPKDTETPTTFIDRLEAIVLENLKQEDFDVESFAQLAGTSRSDLYRKIKKTTGKSVTQFVRDIRLNKALEYLRHGELTASQVAFEVGFNSPTYFNKCFKEKYGFTPGEAAYYPDEINELLGKRYAIKTNPNTSTRPYLIILILMAFVGVAGFSFFYYEGEGEASEKPLDTKAGVTVGVLPFKNLTRNPEDDWICNTISREINTALVNYKGVSRVAPMTSVTAVSERQLTVEEIASILKVRYILDGTVERNDQGLQVTLHLIDAVNEKHMWSETIDLEWNREESKKIQRTVASRVINILGLKEHPHQSSLEYQTDSDAAYSLFHRGLYQHQNFSEQGLSNSRELFEQAIEEDPDYLSPYYFLADSWLASGLIWGYTPQNEAWKNAKSLLFKILQKDPENTSAKHLLVNGRFYYDLDASGVYPHITNQSREEIVRLHPDYALKTGHYKTAMEGTMMWIEHDPANADAFALKAINYYFLGERDKARALLDKNYDLYKNDLNFLREATKAYYFLGEYDKMKTALQEFLQTFKERPPIIRWMTAIVADKYQNPKLRDTQLKILHDAYQKGASGSPAWFIALYAAYEGNYDKCIDWLEKSFEAREVEMTWLAQEPDLAPLGPLKRYQALLDSIRFPESARTHVINSQ